MSYIVVMIISCASSRKRFEHLEIVRKYEQIKHMYPNIVIYRIVGRQETVKSAVPQITVDCDDYYEYLPTKIVLAIKHIVSIHSDLDYLIKVDDDIEVNLDKLLSTLKEYNNVDYGGYVMNCTQGIMSKHHFDKCHNKELNTTPRYIPPFRACAGCMYILSKKSAEIISKTDIPYPKDILNEDVHIGITLEKHDIQPTHIHTTDNSLEKYLNNVYIGWNNLDHIQYKKLNKYPQTLTEIMNKHGSDKGAGQHTYTEKYQQLFERIRHKKINLLEIGIGSVNPDIISNMTYMGKNYVPGASLRAWKEYFYNGNIYGCDIDKNILFQEDRIETFYLDQKRPEIIQQQICDKDRIYDIIIDDGLHHFPTNWKMMKQIFDKLSPNGIYIIEDVANWYFDQSIYNDPFYIQKVQNGVRITHVKMPLPCNQADNNMFIVEK